MAYVRIKKIRNKKTGTIYEYAYLVANKWRKKGARQKVKEYLGKVIRPQKKEVEFNQFVKGGPTDEFLAKTKLKQVIETLVLWELAQHGQTPHINWKTGELSIGKQPVSFDLNDGMLNRHTLKQLLYFKVLDDDRETGIAFARAFVDAGIDVPHDIFVHLFSQLVLEDQII